MTLAAGTQIGKYVVRQKLAEGGMAEIFLCAAQGPEGFEKEVVIKRVRSYLATDPGFVQMFIAEARVASRLNHANVVQIFDFDKHEDTYYLAMEYVRGCSLADLRKRCKQRMEAIPPVLVAHIGAEVARGMHYAHRLRDADGVPMQLVHRDVTPQNVLLSFDGAVKLTDFGIAKAGKSFTAPGMLKGKFAYMSPEQARGEEVDARTDIFALGVVLWELLTGGRLFEGNSEVAVLRAVQQSVIPPPARLNPDVPEELDAVVRKALERDPAVRYQSAYELERALAGCALHMARSVEDTDVGAFVRRMHDVGFTMMVPIAAVQSAQEGSGTGGSMSAPRESTAVQTGESKREPTAVLPGSRTPSGSGIARAVSPDEDIHAPTHVLERRTGSPPTEPMPSVRSRYDSSPGRPAASPGSAASSPGRPASNPALTPVAPPAAEPRAPSGPVKSVSQPSIPSVAAAPVVPSKAPSMEALPVIPSKAPSMSLPAVAAQGQGTSSSPRRTGLVLGLAAVGLAAALGTVALVRSGKDSASPQPPAATAPTTPTKVDQDKPVVTPPQPTAPVASEDAGVHPVAVVDAGTQEDAGTRVAETQDAGTPPVAENRPDAGERPVEPPVAPKAPGFLTVRAIPFATVLVDGKSKEVQGRTTYTLAPGPHKLVFQHPAGTKSETVTIESGKTVQREFRATAPH